MRNGCDALSCAEAAALVASQVDENLDAAGRERLSAHLVLCEACRTELEALRAVRFVLGSRPEASLPVGFEVRLASRLADSSRWLPRTDWRLWAFRLAPVAAALAVIVGAVSGRFAQEPRYPDLSQILQTWATGEQPQTTPVSAILLQPQVSKDSLLAAVLMAKPDTTLADYVEGYGHER